MAELQREQKRARTAAAAPNDFARPPRPFLEDFGDEDESLSDQPGRRDRRVVTRQPGGQIQVTSDAAGQQTAAAPSRVGMDLPQESRNGQPGKILIPTTALSWPGSHNAAGQPGRRATPSARPASTTVDLTEDDDEDEENNGVPLGKRLHSRVISRFD